MLSIVKSKKIFNLYGRWFQRKVLFDAFRVESVKSEHIANKTDAPIQLVIPFDISMFRKPLEHMHQLNTNKYPELEPFLKDILIVLHTQRKHFSFSKWDNLLISMYDIPLVHLINSSGNDTERVFVLDINEVIQETAKAHKNLLKSVASIALVVGVVGTLFMLRH